MIWLKNELDRLGLDGEAFSAYIVDLLESSDPSCSIDVLRGFLSELGLTEASEADLTSQIVDKWSNKLEFNLIVEPDESPECFSACESEGLKSSAVDSCYPDGDVCNTFNDWGNDVDGFYGDGDSCEEQMDKEHEAMNMRLQLLAEFDCTEQAELFSREAISCAIAMLQNVDNVEYWRHSVVLLLEAALQCSQACRPCRFVPACLMSGCAFHHDLHTVPCRFWLGAESGGCLSERSGCKFAHGFEALRPFLPEPPSASDSSDCFPALSPVASHSSSPNPRLRLPAASYKSAVLASRPGFDDENNASSCGQRRTPSAPKLGSVSMCSEWVEGGKAVSAEYSALRSEARELAVGRNRLLEEATKAFLRGDGAAAKALSVQGQRVNALMKEKHRIAAECIFKARNSPASIAAGRVDLHGLHVAEAQELLPPLLGKMQETGARIATVVCGSGHHSAGPQRQVPRLLPTAERVCRELGLQYLLIKDGQGFVGGLRVELTR